MPKLLITGASGLHTTASDFASPPNAQDEASNIILRDAGIIEQRRGMLKQPSGYDLTSLTSDVGGLYSYSYTPYYYKYGSLYYDTGTAWSKVSTTVGTDIVAKSIYARQNNNAVEALQNLYVCSCNGLYMTDTLGSQLYKAGFDTPPPIITVAATATAPTSNIGLTAANAQGSFNWNGALSAAAYRVVWGRKDSHGRIFYSEPSARTLQYKSDATTTNNYAVTGDVPTIAECSSSVFYQVFRSETVDKKDNLIIPSDNMYQVYEGLGADVLTLTGGAAAKAVTTGGGSAVVTVTKTAHGYRDGMKVYFSYAAGDTGANEFVSGLWTVANATADTFTYNDGTAKAGAAYTNLSTATATPKYFPFKDYTPDLQLVVPLYTNPIDSPDPAPNVQPPAACDIAFWKNRMWFANTNGKHAYTISLLGTYVAAGPTTNNPDGLVIGDTVTINGMVFVAAAAAIYGSLTFAVATAGDPATNIETTARSLVDTINNYTGNTTIRAVYLSSDTDNPGIIRLECLKQKDASFEVSFASGRAAAWAPYVPGIGISKNDTFINRLYYSKPNQPESVPALNYIDVGAGNKAIFRIVPVRESLYVFKEDGVFVINGDYPFRLDLVDGKTVASDPRGIVGGESCVYGVFNSGVCRIDSNGVRIISSPIANDFRQLYVYDEPFVAALNEIDGVLLLKVVEGAYTESAFVWHCYNIRTNAWTRWDFTTGNYPITGIDSALFLRNSTGAMRLLAAHNRITGVSPVTWTSSLFKETVFYDSDNYNLQYIEGSFAESTATVNGAISGGTVGVSKTIVLNSAFSGGVTPQLGDIIYAGALLTHEAEPTSADYYGLITAINSTTSYTVKQVSTKATGDITNGATVRLLRSFDSRVTYNTNSPSNSRHYRDVTFMFKDFYLNSPESIVFTDQNSTEANSDVIFTDANTAGLRMKRVLIPSGHQYANAMTVGLRNTEAGTYFRLQGVGLTYEDVSERNSK